MKSQLIVLFSLFLLIASCQKDRLFGDKKILIGTWNWRTTTKLSFCEGSMGYSTYSPTSTDTNYKVVFLRKGIIQFYENETLLSEHKIKFNRLDIEKEGIVESHKDISFLIFLDGNKENRLYGKGTTSEFIISDFPYSDEEDCVAFTTNVFRKE